jgi:hypothetical protein
MIVNEKAKQFESRLSKQSFYVLSVGLYIYWYLKNYNRGKESPNDPHE